MSAPPDELLLMPLAAATFVAIDFETADYWPDSACGLGLVRVERRRIVERRAVLLRPPRRRIRFAPLHGITWERVKDAPTFAEVWPELSGLLHGADLLAAHNAAFDRRVLWACCAAAGLPVPTLPFVCTVRVARYCWGQKPNDLPSVCRRLDIPLKHHDPGSDAEACARILIAASHLLDGCWPWPDVEPDPGTWIRDRDA